MRVERYHESRKDIWDQFVAGSKNGTFLFQRDYMDYHRDRFEDYSLLLWDEDILVALLPANADHDVVSSHGGLTYGGFLTDEKIKLPRMLEVFDAALGFLRENSFRRVIYKTIPHIYHRLPAEEDHYALFLCNAQLVRRGVLTVCASAHPLPIQERRRRGARKASQQGLVVKQTENFEAYWDILAERLMEAFGARPAHSLAEIQLLQSRFPDNIKLFCALEGESTLGGVVIYETDEVAHAQYIAANERCRTLGALDLVFTKLLGDHYKSKRYFDFGTSDEADGRVLNRGLIDQKEGYGARAVAHDHYAIDLTDWKAGALLEAMR
jgi:Acetyltransferase (GNAT) domain